LDETVRCRRSVHKETFTALGGNMAAATGLTIIKRFSYRGDSMEEYSNTYWFTGTAPADATAWRALFDAVVTLEKACYPAAVTVVRGYGYNDDAGHKPDDEGDVAPAVWTVDLTVAPDTPVVGTCGVSGGAAAGGDSAVWVRWKTSRVTSPGGKAIYLRKYFHPAILQTGTTDTLGTVQKANLLALGAGMYSGTLPGSRKITTAGKTDVILGHGASTYVTVRTLKRRGKRT